MACGHDKTVTCRECVAFPNYRIEHGRNDIIYVAPPTSINEQQFRELVGIAIGRASMCWSETPKGTFDSTTACKLVDEIVEAAKKL